MGIGRDVRCSNGSLTQEEVEEQFAYTCSIPTLKSRCTPQCKHTRALFCPSEAPHVASIGDFLHKKLSLHKTSCYLMGIPWAYPVCGPRRLKVF